MTTRVYVLDDWQGTVARLDARRQLDGQDVELTVLTEHYGDPEQLSARIRDVDVLVLLRERTQLTARIIGTLPKLKAVVQTGRLSGCIDLAACEARGIAVFDGGGSPIAPAELTWALILAASRRLVPYVEQMKAGAWQRSAERLANEALGSVVHGRTLGVWALGKIGSRVAGFGRAFDMNVLVHGREQSRAAAEQAGYEYVADRREFLERTDILSLHLKLTAETRHMVSADDLAAMRPGSMLVNTSRAELIAPGALLQALDAGRPGFAALDVFENEPDGAAPYLAHPRVLCTPHLGFVERDTYELYFGTAFRQVREFCLAQQGIAADGNN